MPYIFKWVIILNVIKKWHIYGFFFCMIFGAVLHYTYDLSGQMRFVGYISAINESVWEHLKLIFFPFLLWSILEYFVYGRAEVDFFAVKATAVLAAMAFVVVFFLYLYGYSRIQSACDGYIVICRWCAYTKCSELPLAQCLRER